MLLLPSLLLCASLADATNLLVASYSGLLYSLSLTESDRSFSLTTLDTTDGCNPSPAWLSLKRDSQTLFCVGEGLTSPNGSLSSFSVARNGSLTRLAYTDTIAGPVSSVFLDPATIALAHYTGSSVSTFAVDAGANFTALQNFTYSEPVGPNQARQEAPHPHEVILDPTGQYLLVPDLGSDLVRIYHSSVDGTLEELESLRAPAGSGPRHAVFWNPYGAACENCTTYFYLLGELVNRVFGYSVTYPAAGGLAFAPVSNSSTYGRYDAPVDAYAAEIEISPDNRFLMVSNRNASIFSLPNFDLANGTRVPSDSLATFYLPDDGVPTAARLSPAGGRWPRNFALNRAGNLVAVGAQESGRVVVWRRDVVSGRIGKAVASIEGLGRVSAVVWNE